MLSNWCQKCRFYHVVFIESFQKLWKDDVTGMLHKVTAGGRIIHMEDKEIIGILDGLISKRVRPFLWKNAKYCGGNAATTLCTCWTLWTLWTRAEQRPPWCHFEWSEVESRNLPALRSLPLLPEKAILLYFCLIVYHLTSDSLKFPQISNPPFGTAYHLSPRESVSHDSQVASAPLRIVFACHPASGWHNQGSSNLKPQISILNSSRSTQPVAIARKGIRHTVRLTSDDGRGTPPLRHFEWSEAESRNPPGTTQPAAIVREGHPTTLLSDILSSDIYRLYSFV